MHNNNICQTSWKDTQRGFSLQTKGDSSDWVLSDLMVLGTVRREATHQKRRPKAFKSKLTPESSLLRSYGSHDGRTEALWQAAKDSSKQLLEAEGPSQKIGSDSLKRFNLLLLRVRRSREMMLMRWEPVCHETAWQQHCLLRKLFLSTQYIRVCNPLSTFQTGKSLEGGEGYWWLTRYITWASWVSHLPAGSHHEL